MPQFIISAEEGLRQLTHLNLNKSEGTDEINPKNLAILACHLATPLAKLFNNSLATSVISVEWKSPVQSTRKGAKTMLQTIGLFA